MAADDDVEASLLQRRRQDAEAHPSRESSSDAGAPVLVSSGPQTDSNFASAVVILAKATIGAGLAALPLTDAMLGWPLATIFLLAMAYATQYTLKVLIRFTNREGTASYTEVVHKSVGRSAGMVLEAAVAAFGLGMMLVYIVISGDMLVGKPGYKGLLCSYLGDHAHLQWTCNRTIVTGLVTIVVLAPLVSFRRMESSRVSSWIGMAALAIWAMGTLTLVIAGAFRGILQPLRLVPDRKLLGSSAWQLMANLIGIIPVFTTAFSIQATAPFVLAELRPSTQKAKVSAGLYSLVVTSVVFLLIALGSYAVFGEGVQSDVLHNFTPENLEPFLGSDIGTVLFIMVRLSFLVSVLSLFPLMMFPSRDGLLRLVAHRGSADLSDAAFYAVSYGITGVLYLLSIVTPSIWGPIQIVGATAGAVIGFIAPGWLALIPSEASLMPNHNARWDKLPGWILISIGLLQGIAGIVSQMLSTTS